MKPSESPYRSYGFRFKGEHQDQVAGLHSIGWEIQTDPSAYNWDGMARSEYGKVIFQYTLNGRGQIDIDGITYELKPGVAFLVDIPSQHRYYLPETSSEWEFIFITLYGKEALKCLDLIKMRHGQIIHLDSNSAPVTHIFNLLEKATGNELQDAYESSAMAYSFLMQLTRHVLNNEHQSWPESVTKAVLYIQQHFAEPISLDDIVEIAGMSKYHFTRLFQQYSHTTPMKFLTKVRMEQAMKLLKNEKLTIDEIAQEVGYANGNYFNKVFRSFIGVSPGKYRSGKSFVPFDEVVTD